MSVSEKIDKAVSSLWQLAVAMASLKHIAGMVLREADLPIDTDKEEDHSQPDNQTHTHDEETEVSGDDCFVNNENTESEELELAALISSLTLTMVCQQNKAPAMKGSVPKELLENVDETKTESIPISSMIGHQLIELDSPLDISEMPLSMAAHVITAHIEKGEHLCNSHENSSMITKKDRRVEEFICKEEDDFREISTLTNWKQKNTNLPESKVSKNSPEENLTVYEASMCTRKLSCLETPLPLSDHKVSMVAHQHSITETDTDSSSLVCHQTPTQHNVQQHQIESTEMSEIETNKTKRKADLAFSATLLAHQVLPVDTSLESSEFPISMVAHMIISNGIEETFHQANENVSMVVHQLVEEETSATEIKKTNETVKALCDYTTTEEEENCVIRESKFISSFYSHQILSSETPLENAKYPVSLSVHTVDNYSEDTDMSMKTEPGMISSMVSHQSCEEEKFTANLRPEELSVKDLRNILPADCKYQQIDQNSNLYSSVNHQLPSLAADGEFITSLVSTEANGVMIGKIEEDFIEPDSGLLNENTNSLVSMAAHIADSLRIESNEAAPTNEENMKIHYQGKRPEGEEEEDVDEIIQNYILIYDNTTRLPKIEQIPSPVEVKMEEFKIKRENTQRIRENNVETNETHIVNNFKGVEFKSCIIVHQQVDEENKTEDSEDILSDVESVSSGDESIQSMLTTTEKINNLNTLEDLISENASENLIAASCKIEENSPVVITTRHQIINEKDKFPSRETDKFKDNQLADIHENERRKHLLTKNQEEETNNSPMRNNETGILRSLPTEAKANAKCKKKEKSQKNSTQIATFNANSGKQTYKIRFKVKPNEGPSKSSVLNYLLGYFGGQQ